MSVVKGDFKKPVPMAPKFVTAELFCHVVGRCECGNEKPLVLTLYPSVSSQTVCDGCSTVYTLTALAFDQVRPNEAIISVGAEIPQILIPS